jgi:uncharacterized sulfatase
MSKSKASRPNILWIVAEDLCPDVGCYGHPLVKTPNIDALARQGVRFSQAFATAPVCSPARSAFNTGMYQTSIGAHHHRTKQADGVKPLPADVRLLSQHLRETGYFTSNANVRTVEADWTEVGKTDFNFTVERAFDGTDWRQRKSDQPFFAQAQCFEVHRNHQTGRFTSDPDNPIDPGKIQLPPYYPDYPLIRRDWGEYLEYIQVLDRKVGAILKRLEQDGLAENTVVFFFGDQGRAHARCKQFLYDGGLQVPFIMRWPSVSAPGTVDDQLVSLIDIVPTCMRMAGVEPPVAMQGRDVLASGGTGRQVVFAARDRCDETYDRIRCVRSRRFKYIRNYFPNRPYMQYNAYRRCGYPVWTLIEVLHTLGKLTPAQEQFAGAERPAEELYDLENDPSEVRNLATDPLFEKELARLRSTLDEWIAETGDQGETSEDQQYTARRFKDRQSPVWDDWMKLRGLSTAITPIDYLRYWEGEFGVPHSLD